MNGYLPNPGTISFERWTEQFTPGFRAKNVLVILKLYQLGLEDDAGLHILMCCAETIGHWQLALCLMAEHAAVMSGGNRENPYWEHESCAWKLKVAVFSLVEHVLFSPGKFNEMNVISFISLTQILTKVHCEFRCCSHGLLPSTEMARGRAWFLQLSGDLQRK